MAEDKVTKSSVSDKDPFGDIRKSAKETTPEIVALKQAMSAVEAAAGEVKKELKNLVPPSDVKTIDEVNKKHARANQLLKAKATITDELVKENLKLQETNKQRNKDLRAQNVLEDKQAGTLQRLAAQNTKLRQEREKLNLETKKGQQRLKEINTQLDKNNKVIERNSDKLKQQKIGIGRYQKALGGLRSSLLKLGAAFGVGFGVQQIRSFGTASIEAFREQQKAIAQVEAGLKSTGNQVGITSEKLQKMASDLQGTTLFGDEQILKDATSQLLTFTNIAGTNFERTQKAALDLATRLDGDLKSASIQLGKALNDPVANLSALSRSGIQFSQSQKDVIKDLTESGRLAEAQTIILDELNKQYGGSAEAAAEADGGITQLSNSIGDAKEKLGEIILEGLKPTIKSLQEFFKNLSKEDIQAFVDQLKTAFRALKVIAEIFLVYKARLIAINVAQKLFSNANGVMNVSLKRLGKNLKDGVKGVGKFGSALKGVGWAAAIALAYELASTLVEVASGAARARLELELLEKAQTRGSEKANEFLEDNNKKLQEQILLIKERAKEEGLSEEQTQKRIDIATKRARQRVVAAKKKLELENAQLQFKIKQQKEVVKALEEEFTFFDNFISVQEQFELDNAKNQLLALTNGLQANNSAIEVLSGGYTDLNNSIREAALSQTNAGEATEKTTEAIKAQTEALEEQEKIFEEINTSGLDAFAREKRAVAELDYLIILKQINIEEARRAGNTAELVELERELLQLQKDRIDAQATLDGLQTDSGAEKQTIEAQAELDKLQLEQTEETAKEEFEIKKEYIDLAEAYFVASADRRIAKIDDEIKAHQKQADFLEQLAIEGNITAQESLAAENQAIAEANAAKEQEERRKQQILAVSAFLQAYTSNLAAGDDSGTAFTKAATSQAVVDQFVSSLAGFHDGTEDTGNTGVFRDEHGVITGYTHKNERVIKATDNKRMGDYSNEEVTRIVENHRLGNYGGAVQLGSSWESQQIVESLTDVKQGLNEVNETIKNRPVSNLEIGNVLATYMAFTQKVTTGGDVVNYKYKITK